MPIKYNDGNSSIKKTKRVSSWYRNSIHERVMIEMSECVVACVYIAVPLACLQSHEVGFHTTFTCVYVRLFAVNGAQLCVCSLSGDCLYWWLMPPTPVICDAATFCVPFGGLFPADGFPRLGWWIVDVDMVGAHTFVHMYIVKWIIHVHKESNVYTK